MGTAADRDERVAALEAEAGRLRGLVGRLRVFNLVTVFGTGLGFALFALALTSGRVSPTFRNVQAEALTVEAPDRSHHIVATASSRGASLVVSDAENVVSTRVEVDASSAGIRVNHAPSSVHLGIENTLPSLALEGAGGRASTTVAGHPEVRLRDAGRTYALRLDAGSNGASIDVVRDAPGRFGRAGWVVDEDVGARGVVEEGDARTITLPIAPELPPPPRSLPVPPPVETPPVEAPPIEPAPGETPGLPEPAPPL